MAGQIQPGAPRSAAEVVRARAVDAAHRGRIVWRDADFGVNRGEFVAVIGPNGSGKTTLFRLLLGLQPPLAGAIEVFGARPERGNPRIGYVPQRHSLDNDTHVAAVHLVHLAYAGARWGLPRSFRAEMEAASSALERVGAANLAAKSLNEMSGGELQRVFLAEALVSDPELLLLDEPLSNLDLRRSRELVQVVHGLVRSRHVTALLVAHDINPLIPYLDKVLYIANGRIAAGTPSEVLTSESLSRLYGVPVEVLRDSRGNVVIVGGENPHEAEVA